MNDFDNLISAIDYDDPETFFEIACVMEGGDEDLRYENEDQNEKGIMTNEERWNIFISELRAYIEEHHLRLMIND